MSHLKIAFPLVSRINRDSEWCEGVREVEEIRQVDGQLVRKLIFMDNDISNAGMSGLSCPHLVQDTFLDVIHICKIIKHKKRSYI